MLFKILYKYSFGLTTCFLILLLNSCGQDYNPKYMTPDGSGSGHILTSLGSLIYGPWQSDFIAFNEETYFGDSLISSVGKNMDSVRWNLVFQLYDGGNIKYWFKNDYEVTLSKKLSPDKNGARIIPGSPPKNDQIKRQYTAGHWRFNINDSTLEILFEDPSLHLPALKGRYNNLGSNNLEFQETFFVDSVINLKKERVKKVWTSYYTHPWIEKLP